MQSLHAEVLAATQVPHSMDDPFGWNMLPIIARGVTTPPTGDDRFSPAAAQVPSACGIAAHASNEDEARERHERDERQRHAAGPVARTIPPDERLEHPLALVDGDARVRVGDAHLDHVAERRGRDVTSPPAGSIAARSPGGS